MAKYIRIERLDYPHPGPHVFKLAPGCGSELAFACHDALRQLRELDLHAINYHRNHDDVGILECAPARYSVRWATIKEWRDGGSK